MINRRDSEGVWVGFARAALAGVTSINIERDPLNGPDWDCINGQIADDCAQLADLMLERWRQRYVDDATDPSPTLPGGLAPPVDPANPVNW